MTDPTHIISQRRRLAMACGCRDRVRAGAVSGQIEGLSLQDEQLWAKIGDEHGYSWVPAESVVVSYHVTPPPAGPASDVSPIPPQGKLRVTECMMPGWGKGDSEDVKYRIICPDTDEIVARPRTPKTAKVALRKARRRHKAELYEWRGRWVHVEVPEELRTVRP
jgi:hypothetical protein